LKKDGCKPLTFKGEKMELSMIIVITTEVCLCCLLIWALYRLFKVICNFDPVVDAIDEMEHNDLCDHFDPYHNHHYLKVMDIFVVEEKEGEENEEGVI